MNFKKVFIVVLIIINVFLVSCKKTKLPDESSIDDDVDELMTLELERPLSGMINNLNPLDNVFISLRVFKDKKYFQSNSTGTANAKFFGINYTQNIEIIKEREKTLNFVQQVSRSMLKKTAEQKMVFEDFSVIRSANKITNSSIEWKNTGKKILMDEYLELYGYKPLYYTGYILNYKTIINYKILKNEADEFTILLDLDPLTSVNDYKVDVKTNGNMNDYPTFYKTCLTISMNKDWEITKLIVEEEYDTSMVGLGNLRCVTKMVEYFSYEEKEILEKSFYQAYFD